MAVRPKRNNRQNEEARKQKQPNSLWKRAAQPSSHNKII